MLNLSEVAIFLLIFIAGIVGFLAGLLVGSIASGDKRA